MLILISDAFDAKLPGRLAKYGEVTDDKNRQTEAEVLLIRSKTKVTAEYMDGAPNLKLVIRGGVGLDNVDLEYARSKGIAVHNTAEASTVAVAELAFALMIALPNHIVRADNSMRAGEWAKSELKRTELMGKTLAILGLGRIGSSLAVRARAFGMKVTAYDPFVFTSEYAEVSGDLDQLLGNADYISMHMPLTPKTKGFIDKALLAKFKKGAYLINSGRGKCVVEEDIVAALKSGQLGGYATDVWYSDPPAADCPLLKAPNSILTPHIGASSKENMARIGNIADAIIESYIASK